MSDLDKKFEKAVGVVSDRGYESRELSLSVNEEMRIETAPLAERKEGQANFLDAMQTRPDIVGQRISWLIEGSYGYGAMLRAQQILASPRMNQVAALSLMIAVYEWRTSRVFAVAAWKKTLAG